MEAGSEVNARLDGGGGHIISIKANLWEQALAEARTLSGLLPICANCKKIRDDQGYWHRVEVYVSKHSGAQFSHGICPDCMGKLYPEFSK